MLVQDATMRAWMLTLQDVTHIPQGGLNWRLKHPNRMLCLEDIHHQTDWKYSVGTDGFSGCVMNRARAIPATLPVKPSVVEHSRIPTTSATPEFLNAQNPRNLGDSVGTCATFCNPRVFTCKALPYSGVTARMSTLPCVGVVDGMVYGA